MTYQIHRYPAELIDVVALGGERVVIRPVLPQDADLTAAFFGNLSPRARHQRFLSPMRLLPPGLVERLTDIDYRQHLALVAEVFAGGRETVIAEARYARLPDGESAEFAISVAEAWRGQGLARLLLKKLSDRAAAAGIRRLVGETLASNAAMLQLARSAQFSLQRSTDVAGLIVMTKTLGQLAQAGAEPAAAA